jgi:GR25 family glycosyltransferase involved in LPS biosynthesis
MREMDQDKPVDHLQEYIPAIDLAFDGNYRHANGIELPVIVINLPRRVDRWETLCRRMNGAGLTRLIKAPAIDGMDLPGAQIAALTGLDGKNVDEAPRSHLSLTRPAVGCFLSHLAIWRRLIDENLPRALILEDDAAPTAICSGEKLQSALAFMPDDAGLVFPGLIIMGGLAERSTVCGLARIYYFNGTFAYFVTPAMCRRLLRHLLPLRSHVDHQISHLLVEQRHALPAYYLNPQLFAPDWSLRSDCYVPLAEEGTADHELGQIIKNNRRLLLEEGRPLLPDPAASASSHAA